MNTNKTAVTVDGKEINLKNYLTTIEKNTVKRRFSKVETLDYTDVANMIVSIISVCKQALEAQEYGMQDVNNLHLGRVLGIAIDLMPIEEMELLDLLNTNM